jgi:putative endopeptidase
MKNTKLIGACALSAIFIGMSSCEQPKEIKSADFNYMDQEAKPSADFYQFANGQWLADNPVPESESRWGSFNEVSERNNAIIRKMLEEASATSDHKKGTAKQLIGDYYAAVMDSSNRDEQGIKPMLPIWNELMNVEKAGLAELIAKHHQNGLGSMFSSYVYQDLKDNANMAVYTGQTRQGLPDKDYYFKQDEKSVETRAEYVKHIASMYVLIGETEENAATIASTIMDIETKLADASMNRLEQRDIQASYNKMSFDAFKATCASFDWDTYFTSIGLPAFDSIIVSQPNYFVGLESLLEDASFDDVKTYLGWGMLNTMAGKLNTELETQDFNFYSTYLRGAKEMKPRWKRAVDGMNRKMGDALGKAFVEENFSAESKARVNTMVDNLGAALKERLAGLSWMSDETKVQAFEKLASFTRKLGYPDTWKDLTSLEISRASFLENWMSVNRFEFAENINKYGKPIDKTEWGMPAHIVNAYYNPTWNEIVFPAGIMQPPFFDPNAEDAVNYARMGAVIGHEMIHGFDDQGAQFDSEGTFKNWWTPEDKASFEAQTSQLADQYDGYEVIDSVFVSGKLTLGENIADFGGLTVAYYAYQKSLEGKTKEVINNYTPEQRFFISFAQIWKGNATDEFLRQQVVTDPHSPTKFRVNGTLSNMPEFFEAFDVAEGAAMRNDSLVSIW